MKAIGIVLIVLQILSYIGNAMSGNLYFPPLSSAGIGYLVGQNLFLIIGIILIWLDARRAKKAASNTNQATQEQSFYESLDSVDRDSENK